MHKIAFEVLTSYALLAVGSVLVIRFQTMHLKVICIKLEFPSFRLWLLSQDSYQPLRIVTKMFSKISQFLLDLLTKKLQFEKL